MTSRTTISICANAFPAHGLDDRLHQLDGVLAQLRDAIPQPDHAPFPLGLWLDAAAMRQLDDDTTRRHLVQELARHGLTAQTANAFPYGRFHHTHVKTSVYLPDWSTPERRDYTLRVARLLADILPPDADGSISTLPCGYRDFPHDRLELAAQNLRDCAHALERLRQQTGHTIRLAVEMEPDCLWETPQQFIDFRQRHLASDDPAATLIGVCYDTCHQELLGGHPGDGLRLLLRHGVPVPKIQFSAALAVTAPQGWQTLLRDFHDDVYLHQTRLLDGYRRVRTALPDMPDAIPDGDGDGDARAVVHYHVPIHATTLAPGLEAARDELLATLALLRDTPALTPHLEIETYTYSVLPGFRQNQAAVIAAMRDEHAFVTRALAQRQ